MQRREQDLPTVTPMRMNTAITNYTMMKQHDGSNSTEAKCRSRSRSRQISACCGNTMLRKELCEAEVDNALLRGDIGLVLKGINQTHATLEDQIEIVSIDEHQIRGASLT